MSNIQLTPTSLFSTHTYEDFPMTSQLEKKTFRSELQTALHYLLVPPENGWLQHYSPKKMALKDSGEEKFSHLLELWAVHLIVKFFLKEIWTKVKIYIFSWAVANGLACCGRHRRIKTFVRRRSREEICELTSPNRHKVRRYVMSYLSAHQKATQKRKLLILTWTRWPVLWISVSIFPFLT